MYQLSWFKEAAEEYRKLDGSQKIQVKKGLVKIQERGLQAGKPLAKKKYDLSMCREIKMRRLGLRIIFKESNESIQIIDIVCVGKRSDEEVFETAAKLLGLL
ncbi:addiction module toxin RelE [Lactobacillus sp. ESL0679]|uniref:type II toxin-antitoxin system RelE family toxin n=1 Tax=Lactobacillus sp. ESL0679 TaxID=2983209 RepID=UPI0023F90B8B|nr:addiction module toxin RelE [Lactobacillus sp. ESL0679]MDF7683332.1 addiction module toxin RelE [Lactobacillus sp. ESL0679]